MACSCFFFFYVRSWCFVGWISVWYRSWLSDGANLCFWWVSQNWNEATLQEVFITILHNYPSFLIVTVFCEQMGSSGEKKKSFSSTGRTSQETWTQAVEPSAPASREGYEEEINNMYCKYCVIGPLKWIQYISKIKILYLKCSVFWKICKLRCNALVVPFFRPQDKRFRVRYHSISVQPGS